MTGFRHVRAKRKKEGEGARVDRAFPTDSFDRIDPFVLLDDFRVEPPHGFPEHPHRGFEAVTFVLEGSFHHQDTSGADKVVHAGGAQVVTMGNGVRHSEMPGDEPCRGLQLWVNLPSEEKDMEPAYQDAEEDELPVEEDGETTVTTVIGPGSPLTTEAPIEYRKIETTGTYAWRLEEGWNGLLYVIEGTGAAKDQDIAQGDLIVLEDGGDIDIRAEDELVFVTIQGDPLEQPIDHHGPFVD